MGHRQPPVEATYRDHLPDRTKEAADRDLLTFAIDANTDGQDFFIRKAIGWALRELAKRDPAWVRSFVADRRAALSGLSRREALKNIDP
jgi:3-methyladenine DNA glycosylase AlkD